MGLHGYVRVVTAYWRVVLICLFGGLAAAVVMLFGSTPTYASQVTFLLSAEGASNDPAAAYQGSLLASEKAKSYVQLLTNERLAGDVAQRLGLDVDPVDLTQRISARYQADTPLITARVTDASPAQAQRIADSLSSSFVALISELERSEATPSPVLVAKVVEPAKLPTARESPVPGLLLPLGGLLGLLAGLAIALVVNAVRSPLRTREDVEDATGAPLLGAVLDDPRAARQPVAAEDASDRRRTEDYRAIRAQLLHRFEEQPAQRIVAVTSPGRGDGRTLTACNLAVALSRSGREVVVIDADTRDPRVSDYLGLDRSAGSSEDRERPGLSSVLARLVELETAIAHTGPGRPDVLPAGPLLPEAGELVASDRMEDLLAGLARRYDLVLIDCPALLETSDATVLAQLSDITILVVRRGTTRRRAAVTAVELLQSVSATIVGVVLNRVPRSARRRAWWSSAVPVLTRLEPDETKPTATSTPRSAAVDSKPAESDGPMEQRAAEPNGVGRSRSANVAGKAGAASASDAADAAGDAIGAPSPSPHPRVLDSAEG